MRNINDINIFDRSMSLEDMNDMLLTDPQTDISPYIKSDNRDFLDRGIEEYEANVPLPAQMLAGFTLPGMAIDFAAAGKYGRDATRQFREGNVGQGFGNLGIAALSGLAAVPLIGELANLAKQPLKKGIASLPSATNKADILKHQADINTGNPLADANKLYDRAVRVAPEFNQQIDDLASNINLKTSLPEQIGKIDGATGQPIGKVKKIPRMVEKARDKYNNDVSQLTDPIRTRVLVKTPAEEEAFVQMLKQNYEVFDKGRLVKPEGFVDRKILLKFTGSNGEQIVGEVSTITAPMWRASDTNHALFEEFRSLFPKGMPTDPKELDLITDNVVKKGKVLQKAMAENFGEAKKQIDPDFYNVVGSSKKGIANLDVASKDLLEEFNLRGGAKLDSQNNVTLYHRTNKESADKIKKTGKMVGKEDRIYFSTKPSGAIKGYGDELVEVKIPIKDLNIEDIFTDEVHVTLKSNSKPTDVAVKKFASGGYVTAGSSGRSAPITPNIFEKSDFDISNPSTKKSATWLGIASVQSELPGDMKYPLYPASVGLTTAGPSSQPKYNVSLSITPSLQKFTKNYNPNDVDIFEVE